MKDKIFGIFQRVGRAFMLPIAILPIAGLFLGVGGSLTNETMLETYNLTRILGPGTFAYAILTVITAAGSIVFDNLPIIFAIGVAIGMAKMEKEVAALAGAIAFFIMHASIGAMITINGGTELLLSGSTASVLGITSLQMGVFGGIIVGLGVAALHNRFHKIELPQVLSFFGGSRFVPIISAVVYIIVGIISYYIWPTIQAAIYSVGDLVRSSGYAGTWIYGLMERLLIPFGLHHVFYLPFWQTAVGGTAEVAGELIEGAQNIFFAELSAKDIIHFNVEATRFMSGKFPLMIFGLPGAAFAMYRCAKPEKREVVGGLLFSAALTSMLTGITEPIEFTFLFVAPLLYGIHCIFAGLAYMLMHLFNVGVGMTFSGGLIDLFLFGILQGNSKTSWLNVVYVGIIYFVVYYYLFKILILKFNYKTPGREEDEQEVKLYTRADYNKKNKKTKEVDKGNNQEDMVSALITRGLGGSDNISDIDACATRLRVTVHDSNKVKETELKQSGAAGVIKKGNGVQVVFGPRVTIIKSRLDEYLANGGQGTEILEDNENHRSKNISDLTSNNNIETVKNTVDTQLLDLGIYSPIEGTVIPLADIGDGVFSAGMLGEGVGIQPSKGRVVSPITGKVSMVFNTKHAIGLTSREGAEILIHVGLETVDLGGQYFTVHVKDGDDIKIGDLLLEFDMEGIKSTDHPLITPVIITNSSEYKKINIIAKGNIKEKDKLLELEN